MKKHLAGLTATILLVCVAGAEKVPSALPAHPAWDVTSAARYLDARQVWWMDWPHAQRDHETACVSCHTVVPYAMARPALRSPLAESGPSAPEQKMLGYVVKRVTLWNEVKPFYSDEDVAQKKTVESRGTESVLNALVLARYDAQAGSLSETTRMAFKNMWNEQLTERSGREEEAGSWNWLNFHNAPWESDESHYWGATLAAVAVGLAPENYKSAAQIQPQLHALESYLLRNYDAQPLVNRIVVLWASGQIPDLIPAQKKAALLEEIRTHQRQDGGWSLSLMGPWKRQDNTALDERSDGYATGLTVYALRQAGVSADTPEMQKAVAWLVANQDTAQGRWAGYSLNKQRDANTDIGHFMSDAATSYAVMALEAMKH